jgi:MFS family permease
LMAMSYMVLLPIFAKDVYRGGPETLGLLTSASGLGALIGALYLASRHSVIGLRRLIYVATLLSGISLLGLGVSTNLYAALFFIFVTAFGLMVQLASINTVLQTIVDDDKRGRVMSFYTLAFLGTSPLGGLLAGVLAHQFGAAEVILLGGISCLAAALIYWTKMPALKAQLRPIYVKKGIIPAGIEAVTQLSNPKD